MANDAPDWLSAEINFCHFDLANRSANTLTNANISSRSFLFRLIALVSLVGIFLWNWDVAKVANYIDLRLLIAVLAVQPLVLIGFAFGAIRLRNIVGEPPPPFFKVFKAVILAYGCNSLIPGRASELLKVTYLHDHSSISMPIGLSGVFLERCLDLFVLALVFAIALGFTVLKLDTNILGIAVLSAVSALLIVVPFRLHLVRLFKRILWEAAKKQFDQLLHEIAVRLKRRTIGLALIYSFLIWLLAYANITLYIGLAGSIQIGLSGALLVFIASAVGAAIPALPAGLGTYEAAVVFALMIYGYGYGEAVALALALHLSQIILSFLGALYIIMTERLGIKSLSEQIAKLRHP